MFIKKLKNKNKTHSKDFEQHLLNKKQIIKAEKPINKISEKIFEFKSKISNLKKELENYKNLNSLEKDLKSFQEKNINLKNDLLQSQDKKIKTSIKFKINNNKKIIYKIENNISIYKKFDTNKINKKIEHYEKQIIELQEKLIPLNENLKPLIKEYKLFIGGGTKKSSNSFVVKDLNVYYGDFHALKSVNIELPSKSVIAIIGPSGCGKSTFLKTLNRINDEIPSFRATGNILLNGVYDIFTLENIKNENDKLTLTELRTKVGMIFQQPNPFPMSIWKNVTYGPRINGIKNVSYLDTLVEKSLKKSALWEEVKQNLNISAISLSGGQQQRLCIARAISNNPEILLMDEPTSALDPIAANKIEELILELKKEYTIIMVTHSMQQAARISDYTAFFYQGELIEFDKTETIFTTPKQKRTDDYLRGRFG